MGNTRQLIDDLSPTPKALTYGANVSWNWQTQSNAQLVLTGNATLDFPSNYVAGQEARLTVIQDTTGGRSLSFNAGYKNIVPPSTGANATDEYVFRCINHPTLGLIISLVFFAQGIEA